jgi:hypothetical protein
MASDTFSFGDLVRICATSLGNAHGMVTKGDTGTITEVVETHKGNPYYYVDVNGKVSRWIATPEDLEMLPKEEQQKKEDNPFAKEFMELCKNALRRAQDKLSRVEEELNAKRNEIADLAESEAELNTFIRSRKSAYSSPKVEAAVSRMLEYMKRMWYAEIYVELNKLVGITKMVELEHRDHLGSKLIPIGKFKIVVNMENKGVEVFACDSKKPVSGSYPHPHVSGKNPCLGNFSSKISELLGRYEWLGVLSTMGEYIFTYSAPNAYKDVRNWLPDADKRCTRCWLLLKKECKCKKEEETEGCPHCGAEHADDCQCRICPRTGEFVGLDGAFDTYCTNECARYRPEGICEG